MHECDDLPEEHKRLLRDLKQAAQTMLMVKPDMNYALVMFRLSLQHEALRRTNNNRSAAARLLGVHRNTFTRNLPIPERKYRERYEGRPPRGVRAINPVSAHAG